MSEQMAEMQALMREQIEAATKEAEAKLLAAQAAERAAAESRRAADSNEKLISSVEKLIAGSARLVDGMTVMEDVASSVSHLIQVTQMLVTIVAKGSNSEEARELRAHMHELAMQAASKGVSVNTGSTTTQNIHDGSVGQIGENKHG